MRIATWAWFSLRARVPWGAPCIFGSIQQARTAAYTPDTPYWSQGRLRPAIWVGGQTPSGQKSMLHVAPDPKMTSISVMLFNCSGTGGACGAEYSVFCTVQGGVPRDEANRRLISMQIPIGFMQDWDRKPCSCAKSARGRLEVARLPEPCACRTVKIGTRS